MIGNQEEFANNIVDCICSALLYEENKKMFELHDKGYDTYSIAKALGKTHLSICDRLKKVQE